MSEAAMELNALIEWLQIQAYPGDAYDEAAAHLRRLAALERDEGWKAPYSDWTAHRIVALEQENVRLRAALEQIVTVIQELEEPTINDSLVWGHALSALEPPVEGGE